MLYLLLRPVLALKLYIAVSRAGFVGRGQTEMGNESDKNTTSVVQVDEIRCGQEVARCVMLRASTAC
jgi:hypothetical protein